MTLPVVPVVDTGVDDALALVVAALAPSVELCAVVCTAGNVSLDRVLVNTRVVLDLLRCDVPVAMGAEHRLDGTPFPARGVHGADGLAGMASMAAMAGPASAGGSRSLLAADVVPADAVVVSLGPLTPMVGLAAGRVVASYARPGEVNYAMDPRAADAVTYEPVDVPPHSVSKAAVGAAGSGGGSLHRLVSALLAHRVARGTGLGDAAVMLMLAEPALEPAEWAHRLVELAGTEH